MIKPKNEGGVTLITLVITILIMVILASTLAINASTAVKTTALKNMYQDIEILKNKISIYYATYHKLPTLGYDYQPVEEIKTIDPNDSKSYQVIDLEALETLTLNHGEGFKLEKQSRVGTQKDVYIINEKSHHIYYARGIVFEGKTYYTQPGEYTKVEVRSLAQIEVKKDNIHKADIEIKGMSLSEEIKELKLYANDVLIKNFTYTENLNEQKVETLTIELPFLKEVRCYTELVDAQNQTYHSEIITLKNEENISNKQELENLAIAVKEGNDFAGKNIFMIADIDLEGNASNMWNPIGDETHLFRGTFNGKNYHIFNLYIDRQEAYQGLFGNNGGTIQNLAVNGTMMTVGAIAGGIAGNNNGTIENCTNNVKISSSGYFVGGIVGTNNGTIEKCSNNAMIAAKGLDHNGESNVGGITGVSSHSVRKSKNLGNIVGAKVAGGISGNLYQGIIEECYNVGQVEITDSIAGGILGKEQLVSGTTLGYARVRNCYSVGAITMGKEAVGGVIGEKIANEKITNANNYYLRTTSTGGISGIDIEVEAIGKTEVELQSLAEALGITFKEDEKKRNNGYPLLSWE